MNFKELAENAHKEHAARKQKEAADRAEKNKQDALNRAREMSMSFFEQFGVTPEYTAIRQNDWSDDFIAAVVVPDTQDQLVTKNSSGWLHVSKTGSGEYYVRFDLDPLITLNDFYAAFFS